MIALYCYKILSILTSPFLFLLILYRANRGKEDLCRLKERLGIATASKTGLVIWLHAASLGEAVVALNLIRHLSQKSRYQFLLTTGTVTSSKLAANVKDLSLTHQYIPIDVPYCIDAFINYWRPEIAIFLESEIWPNLLHAAKKTCPVLLLNARMSDRSCNKWRYFRSLLASCLKCFKFILTQSQEDYLRFKKLGAQNVVNLGNLKFSNSKLDIDEDLLASLRRQILGRKILFAASTHQGDEEFIIACYKSLKLKHKDLLLIIAPRHPDRAPQIGELLKKNHLVSSLRSAGQTINDKTDIYLADTIGELGLFFSISSISFIGGSIKNGGHSIIEPSFFNTLILFGPDMSNFSQVASEYIAKNAAVSFCDLSQATDLINRFLQFPRDIEQYSLAAMQIIKDKKQILSSYLQYIEQFL